MSEATEAAKAIKVGPYEFDHPKMIRARRLWAELLQRGGELAEGDMELVTYFQVISIRDRLMADVIDPYAWDDEEYAALFEGVREPDEAMVDRMRAATNACKNLCDNHAVTEDWPPMIMISVMIQWLVGNSPMAIAGTQIALTINPAFDLAQVMMAMMMQGKRPVWAAANS